MKLVKEDTCDIEGGQRFIVESEGQSMVMNAPLVEAILAAEAALEEGEHCTCWEHVEGMRVALRQLLDAMDRKP